MSTVTCIVRYCSFSNLTREQLQQRRRCSFPKNEKLLSKWVEALNISGLSNLSPSELYKKRICSLHFESKYIKSQNFISKQRILTDDAVPSLMLREEDILFPENNKCCIPECDSYEWPEERRYATFPKVLTTLKSWVRVIPTLHDVNIINIYSKYKICNMHFPKESRNTFFDQPVVNKDAVPSLFLPEILAETTVAEIEQQLSQNQIFPIEDNFFSEENISFDIIHPSTEPVENKMEREIETARTNVLSPAQKAELTALRMAYIQNITLSYDVKKLRSAYNRKCFDLRKARERIKQLKKENKNLRKLLNSN